ncbi:transposase [Sporichthya polymorpha]|uniref:transposase n=1 Tax=Sporichthya polymorpha TaxID=35751 RepID=UPI0003A2FE68|nr:transposase [Sporichthya polymorpha]
MSERAVPFHCPYCAEETLRPLETHGQWACASCRRAFALKFLGLAGDTSNGSSEEVSG